MQSGMRQADGPKTKEMRTEARTSLSRGTTRRIAVAVVVAYLTNALLVTAMELLLSSLGPEVETPRYYFVDLIFQCLFTVAAGYVCNAIARSTNRAAMISLIMLGIGVGTISLLASWKTEPHWYGIALLAVYTPCVWIGWRLKGNGRFAVRDEQKQTAE